MCLQVPLDPGAHMMVLDTFFLCLSALLPCGLTLVGRWLLATPDLGSTTLATSQKDSFPFQLKFQG